MLSILLNKRSKKLHMKGWLPTRNIKLHKAIKHVVNLNLGVMNNDGLLRRKDVGFTMANNSSSLHSLKMIRKFSCPISLHSCLDTRFCQNLPHTIHINLFSISNTFLESIDLRLEWVNNLVFYNLEFSKSHAEFPKKIIYQIYWVSVVVRNNHFDTNCYDLRWLWNWSDLKI